MIKWYNGPFTPQLDGATIPADFHERAECRNCHRCAERHLVLSAPVGANDVHLYACQVCGAHYFEGPMAGAYADLPAGGTDALAFYLQQGANIGGMAMRLQALGRPAGTIFLEVGCGFGLSLDFARRMLDWRVQGLDPSPFAVEGREQLGLPIESRHLEANGLDHAAADVIHASEFIEHMADPIPMLATLRQALRPGGTLLLTTPAAEMIRADTGNGLLVPLLSAGWHLVIQTTESLNWALRQAGFKEVSVVREGAQLVALAGRLPVTSAAIDRFRPLYRDWLRQIGDTIQAQSDLGMGATARLYRELVVAGLPEADLVWERLGVSVQARYGRSLDELAAAPADASGLAALVTKEPLGLAGMLLARGWQSKRADENARPWFDGAIAAAQRLRSALHAVGADDGDAEDIALAAEGELILLAAAAGEAGIAARLEALRQAGGQHHADGIAPACFVTLVNTGALTEARRLSSLAQLVLSALRHSGQPLTASDASVVYCAAALELQTESGDHAQAVEWLVLLRRMILQTHQSAGHGAAIPGANLYWPAVDAEMLGWRLMDKETAAQGAAIGATQAAMAARFPPRSAT